MINFHLKKLAFALMIQAPLVLASEYIVVTDDNLARLQQDLLYKCEKTEMDYKSFPEFSCDKISNNIDYSIEQTKNNKKNSYIYFQNGRCSKIGFIAWNCDVLTDITPPVIESKNVQSSSKTPKKLIEFKEIVSKNWIYSKIKDMDGDMSYFASTTSLNSASFNFPYNGGSSLSLDISTDASGKNRIASLTISKGQFDYFGDGILRIKFDEKKSDFYEIKKGSVNGTTDAVQITDKKFFKLLFNSKKLIIQPKFYTQGYADFNFDVSNLQDFFTKN